MEAASRVHFGFFVVTHNVLHFFEKNVLFTLKLEMCNCVGFQTRFQINLVQFF